MPESCYLNNKLKSHIIYISIIYIINNNLCGNIRSQMVYIYKEKGNL